MTAHIGMNKIRTFMAVASASALLASLGTVSVAAAATEATAPSTSAAAPVAIEGASERAGLQRPVIQVFSQYRSKNRTAVKVASIVPIEGAVKYRLERYDPSTGFWRFQGTCKRVCSKTYSNTELSDSEQFQMRAVDARGKMSLPSMPLTVIPQPWNRENKPGAIGTYRLGKPTYGLFLKAVDLAMAATATECGYDDYLRANIAQAAAEYYPIALDSPIPGSVLTAFVESLAASWSQCGLVQGLGQALLDVKAQIDAGQNTDFTVSSAWRLTQQYPGGDTSWLCEVSLPTATGEAYRSGDDKRECLNFVRDRLWQVIE